MTVIPDRMVRYHSWDFLKGIACIAVVLIHFQFPGRVGFAVRQMSRFAVPLFFCISGFFFIKPGKQIEAAARKLQHSIFLLLWAMVFYIGIVCIGLSNISIKSYIYRFLSYKELCRFFIENAPYYWPHLWFLGGLAYTYLFALLWFSEGRLTRTAGPIGLLLLIGTIAFQEFASWLPFEPSLPVFGMGNIRFCVLFVFRALPFFMIGIWLKQHEEKIRSINCPSFACAVLVTVGAALAVIEAKLTVNSQFYIGNYLQVAGMFIWGIKNTTAGWKAMVFAGQKLSLYVYIGHIIVGFWIKRCAKVINIVDTVAFHWLYPIAVVLLSMVLSGVVYAIVCIIKNRSQRHCNVIF